MRAELRVATALNMKRAGSPQTSRNSERAMLNHATNGAPEILRKINQ